MSTAGRANAPAPHHRKEGNVEHDEQVLVAYGRANAPAPQPWLQASPDTPNPTPKAELRVEVGKRVWGPTQSNA